MARQGAPGLVMGPCIVEIDGIFIRDVQYQFELNRCGKKGHIKIPNSALSHICSWLPCKFQGSSAYSVGGECGQDGRTDGGDNHIIDFQNLNADPKEIVARMDGRTDGGDNHIIPTFSPKSWAVSPGESGLITGMIYRPRDQADPRLAYISCVPGCVPGCVPRCVPGCVPGFAVNVIRTNFLTKFHEDLIQDIIKTNVLIKFHDGWTIHEKSPDPGGHVFQATGTIFELVHHYNDDGTINVASEVVTSNVMTNFHEDVALRVLTTKCPPPGGHVFQPNETFFFKLVQDIIGINLLTKFHEYLEKVLASGFWLEKKNTQPPGGHVFDQGQPL
ncbi:hypothetical protein DPMN_019930 [Dreissena polymorpha]|uniref:Uncharacterized protein n=1 Tax=Dreissena polymorpha TaxID=45954 RepID=A0A9D4NK46_DREPO|nr:hypothetical protein DPMN_019930 [Dreissena polymorpha]